MGYSAADTAAKHERILDEASRLFRERGFSGVSVSEIMKAAGLTHGPFYNHFSSKETLMAEALAHGVKTSLADLDKVCGSANGKTQYVEDYLCAAHRDSPGAGCTIAALSAEVRQERQVRRPFTVQLKALVQKLTHCLPWSSKRASRGEAIRMLSSLVGAMILARAVDDRAFSDEILREVRKGFTS